jgi:hypothetical protein
MSKVARDNARDLIIFATGVLVGWGTYYSYIKVRSRLICFICSTLVSSVLTGYNAELHGRMYAWFANWTRQEPQS